jgi:hypothetical protein
MVPRSLRLLQGSGADSGCAAEVFLVITMSSVNKVCPEFVMPQTPFLLSISVRESFSAPYTRPLQKPQGAGHPFIH